MCFAHFLAHDFNNSAKFSDKQLKLNTFKPQWKTIHSTILMKQFSFFLRH